MDLASATVVLVRIFLVVTMLGIGIGIGLGRSVDEVGRRIRRGRALLPVVLANLVALPLVAIGCVAIARSVPDGLDDAVAVALLAVAIAPAGSIAPKLVQLAGGDLVLGLGATFGLTIIGSLAFGPSLAVADSLLDLAPTTAPLDIGGIVASLAIFQLLPTLVGWTLGRHGRPVSRRAVRPLFVGSNVLVLAIAGVAIADTADEVLVLGGAPVLVMLAITLAAIIIGRLAGDGTTAGRRATMLVTAQRSPGLALLVVAGPGHAVETATVTVFALVLLIVNGSLAVLLGHAADLRRRFSLPAGLTGIDDAA